jgi:hypothetical protein
MITLESLVRDKDVLLVGNSGVLNDLKMGKVIDSYECVIRFNHAIAHLNPETTGIKTDIWMFAMKSPNVCRDVYRKSKYKPTVCVRYGINKPVNGLSYIVFDMKEQKQKIRDLLEIHKNRHPSTGIVTMGYLIDQCSPSGLTCVGFDSFSLPNFYLSFNSNALYKWHDSDKEAQFISDQITRGKIHQLSS